MKKVTTVPEYIAREPKVVQAMLKQLRAAMKALSPEVEEKISYGMPGYKLHGRPLMYFAAFKQHIGVYAMSNTFLRPYSKELKKYSTSTGTIRFPIGEKLPMTLIKRLLKAKMKANEKRA